MENCKRNLYLPSLLDRRNVDRLYNSGFFVTAASPPPLPRAAYQLLMIKEIHIPVGKAMPW